MRSGEKLYFHSFHACSFQVLVYCHSYSRFWNNILTHLQIMNRSISLTGSFHFRKKIICLWRPFTDTCMHVYSYISGLFCAVSLHEHFKLCWPVNQVTDQGNVYSDSQFYILCFKSLQRMIFKSSGQGRGQVDNPCRQHTHQMRWCVESYSFSHNTSFRILIQRKGVGNIIFELSLF